MPGKDHLAKVGCLGPVKTRSAGPGQGASGTQGRAGGGASAGGGGRGSPGEAVRLSLPTVAPMLLEARPRRGPSGLAA